MRSIFYRISANTFVQILGKIISTAFSLVTVSLLTRYLGKEGFGSYTLVFTYLSFFSISADLGLQLTMVREIAKKKEASSIYYGSFFWLKLSLVLFSTLLALAVLVFFPYPRILKAGIILASLGVSLGNLNNFGVIIFQANLRMDLVTLVDVAAKILTAGLIIFLVFIQSGFYSIINAVLIGNLVASFLIFIFLKRFIKYDFKFSYKVAKALLIKSLPVGLLTFLAFFNFKIDTLLLSIYRSIEEVGVYSLAYKIIENLFLPWSYYMATVYPLLANLYKDNLIQAEKLFKKSIITAIISSSLIILIGFIFAPLIIRILGGEEFKESLTLLRILLFSLPFFFINNLYYHMFLVKETFKKLYQITCLSLIINLALNLLLISKWGSLAAASNVLITEIFILFLYIFFN
jgi:O-antigen/teichoic acid export membrane protein